MIIRKAESETEIIHAKQLADHFKAELGFHTTAAYRESAAKGEILIALMNGKVAGFCRFHHRRDRRTTLYEIAVDPDLQGQSIGRRLIQALKEEAKSRGSLEIRLKCPVSLKANLFYQRIGFERASCRSLSGKKRRLFEWRLPVNGQLSMPVFVASITASGNDLGKLVQLWERFGERPRPFQYCIVTPLFAEPSALRWIRYMKEQWGVKVVFDSGGFFVQQGKITYEELFSRLLDFYLDNDWADRYVLPDFVPTSNCSSQEINERVQVTISGSIRFYRRLPNDYRQRAQGVLQGYEIGQLKKCLEAFTQEGIHCLGFGSFDTGGRNSEINLLTDAGRQRLDFIKRWLDIAGLAPDLHFFGVGSTNLIYEFAHYGATSFDSSGWLRTAGFGNVYLPSTPRRNVSHGGASLNLGKGLTAAAFYTLAEQFGHRCSFCEDFSRLQNNRLYRMWHNACVFHEVTQASGLSCLPMQMEAQTSSAQ